MFMQIYICLFQRMLVFFLIRSTDWLEWYSVGDLYFVPSGHSDHLNCHRLFHYHIHPEQAKASQPLKYISF